MLPTRLLRPRLFSFASDGKVQELQELLSTLKSVKVLDSKGRTALNIAVTEEHLDMVKVGHTWTWSRWVARGRGTGGYFLDVAPM